MKALAGIGSPKGLAGVSLAAAAAILLTQSGVTTWLKLLLALAGAGGCAVTARAAETRSGRLLFSALAVVWLATVALYAWRPA